MSKNNQSANPMHSIAGRLLLILVLATALTSCTDGTSSESLKEGLRRVKRVAVRTVSKFRSVLSAAAPEVASETVGEDQQWAERTAVSTIAKIRKGHPRIFITPERIPELKRQATSANSYHFGIIKQRVRGPQAALLYALGADRSLGLEKSRNEYGRIAADALMNTVRQNSPQASLDGLAIIYDWAYGALTEEERKAFVAFCRSRLGNKIAAYEGRNQGYRVSPTPQGIIPLLAIYGDGIDDNYARNLLTQGLRDTLMDNLAREHITGKDGGSAEGTSYLGVGGSFFTFLALGIATDTDFFFEHEPLSKIVNQLVYSTLPFTIKRVGWTIRAPYFATFHDNWTLTPRELGSGGEGLANMLTMTAAEYRRHGDEKKAQLYTWFVKDSFGGIPYQGEEAINFALMDFSIQPKTPGEVGLSVAEALGWDEEKGQIDRDRFGKKAGIGWVSMRSRWDDPDATFAIFKAEPFYYHGHMHRDSLAFMIAKGEELALARAGNYMPWYEGGPLKSNDPGWPQMGNFFSRTISTNNLLIYDPAEKFDGWANDGGQRGISYWDDRWGRGYNGTADGNSRDIGGLIRFEQTKNYVYTAADATRSYDSTLVISGKNSPKVRLVQREFVYLRSPSGDEDAFVIFDRVEAVKADFKKFWLLHLRAKPQLDGTHSVAVGSEDGGIHLSQNTSSIRVVQERSELWGKILLPKEDNRIVRRLGGWVTTRLRQPLKATDDGPMNIEVESTEGMPDHPVVIITAQESDPTREVFDRFSEWPNAIHATQTPVGRRVCYFCEGKAKPGKGPARLLNCIRATRSAPGFDIPAGARVIQEFRHMGIEGAERDRESERIDYPWGYGLGYNYGDGNQYGLWRLEVSPKRPAQFDNFLHVLSPSLKGARVMKTSLIESDSGNVYGAQIEGRAVLFSKTAEPQLKGSYKVSGEGRIVQILCNLKPGRNYRISQDNQALSTGAATKQGILVFEAQLKGRTSSFDFQAVN